MKYLLLAATVITLSLTACGDEGSKVGTGKPGQYPPSVYDKRDSAPPGPEEDVAGEDRHEAPAAEAPAE